MKASITYMRGPRIPQDVIREDTLPEGTVDPNLLDDAGYSQSVPASCMDSIGESIRLEKRPPKGWTRIVVTIEN